jgi:hypothetical protein
MMRKSRQKQKPAAKFLCCFEYYDNVKKQPYQCGKPAVFIYQEKFPLCEECSKGSVSNTMLKRI